MRRKVFPCVEFSIKLTTEALRHGYLINRGDAESSEKPLKDLCELRVSAVKNPVCSNFQAFQRPLRPVTGYPVIIGQPVATGNYEILFKKLC